jgi:mxaA protein
MRSELDWFFTYSNRYFFTSGMVVVQLDLEKLKEFCKQCRKIERGSQ